MEWQPDIRAEHLIRTRQHWRGLSRKPSILEKQWRGEIKQHNKEAIKWRQYRPGQTQHPNFLRYCACFYGLHTCTLLVLRDTKWPRGNPICLVKPRFSTMNSASRRYLDQWGKKRDYPAKSTKSILMINRIFDPHLLFEFHSSHFISFLKDHSFLMTFYSVIVMEPFNHWITIYWVSNVNSALYQKPDKH